MTWKKHFEEVEYKELAEFYKTLVINSLGVTSGWQREYLRGRMDDMEETL